jgi:2Fe-2S ferredoxin
MAEVTFIQFSGEQTTIDAGTGDSVMKVATDNLVPGIDADCGGECSCATCHVLVTDAWLEKTGDISEAEHSMLDLNPDRQPNSRLSCQIAMSNELDGLVVNLPEFQY